MTHGKSLYDKFIRDFSLLCENEIEADDLDGTVQNVVTLIDKCELGELLAKIPEPKRGRTRDRPNRDQVDLVQSSQIYRSFSQRFCQLFRQEIECENEDDTINFLADLMSRAGLKDLLDQVPVEVKAAENPAVEEEPRPPVERASTRRKTAQSRVDETPNSSTSSQSKKRVSGYNLFVKETMADFKRRTGKAMGITEAAVEWKALNAAEKKQYAQKARELNE